MVDVLEAPAVFEIVPVPDVMIDVLEAAAVLETIPVLVAMVEVLEVATDVDIKRLVEPFEAIAELDREVLVVVVVLVELLSTF